MRIDLVLEHHPSLFVAWPPDPASSPTVMPLLQSVALNEPSRDADVSSGNGFKTEPRPAQGKSGCLRSDLDDPLGLQFDPVHPECLQEIEMKVMPGTIGIRPAAAALAAPGARNASHACSSSRVNPRRERGAVKAPSLPASGPVGAETISGAVMAGFSSITFLIRYRQKSAPVLPIAPVASHSKSRAPPLATFEARLC